MIFEFVIPRRPLSLQTPNRANLQEWKRYVGERAAEAWGPPAPLTRWDLHLTLVFLCESAPIDADNIIKPIQDALSGVVYDDDIMVVDVESHRRFFSEIVDLTDLPPLLLAAVLRGEECVYVRVERSVALGDYL